MKYTLLGNTGIEVSRLAFGTMSFGNEADEATSAALYHRNREAGVNIFDTANVYSCGRSEEILGRLIEEAKDRDNIVLATKVFGGTGTDRNHRGNSRRHILWEVERSLQRLRTDRIDVYFLHGFDDKTPVEETLGALDTLVQSGKILYPAVSNWAAWQIADALGISERKNWAKFQVLQPIYSLVKRQVESEIFPLAQAKNLAVLPYSPLGSGLLTGKYNGGKQPEVGRLLVNERHARRYRDEETYDIAQRFTDYAREHGVSAITLAVAWAASHPAVTAPIIGARSVAQLNESLAAADVELSPTQRKEISQLSYTPPLATDRRENQEDRE
ncbi:aldo-keto reductase YhdN [Abditibacteriota bacterium]|nr:aldo-keto reductase YhdN [Abditibacteriota bacterium]